MEAKVGNRHTLNFTSDALEVKTDESFRQQIPWSDISKIDAELSCFTGIITIASNNSVSKLTCKPSQVQRAAALLYLYGRRTSQEAGIEVPKELETKLQKLKTVTLYHDGILLRTKPTLCRSKFQFVPWKGLASVSLSSDKKTVTMRSAINTKGQEQVEHSSDIMAFVTEKLKQSVEKKSDDQEKQEQTVKLNGDSKEQGQEEQPDESAMIQDEQEEKQGIFKFKGKTDLSQAMFNLFVYLMSGGCKESQLKEYPIGTVGVNANLSKAGIFVVRKVGILGSTEKYFMPWQSMVYLKFQPDTFYNRQFLALVDRTGYEVKLPGADLSDFNTWVSVIQGPSEQASDGEASGVQPMSKEGVLLSKKSGPSFYVPWSRIAGFGQGLIIAENGEQFQVGGNKNVLKEATDLKYDSASLVTLASFNNKQCELTNKSISLTINGNVRVYDLERVTSCRVSHNVSAGSGLMSCGGFKKAGIVLSIALWAGKQDVIQFPVNEANTSPTEKLSVAKLAKLIVYAASLRKQECLKVVAERVKASS